MAEALDYPLRASVVPLPADAGVTEPEIVYVLGGVEVFELAETAPAHPQTKGTSARAASARIGWSRKNLAADCGARSVLGKRVRDCMVRSLGIRGRYAPPTQL